MPHLSLVDWATSIHTSSAAWLMQYSPLELTDVDGISVSRRPSRVTAAGLVAAVLVGLAFGVSIGAATSDATAAVGLSWLLPPEEPPLADECWPFVDVKASAQRSLGKAASEPGDGAPSAKRQRIGGGGELCTIKVPRKDWPENLGDLADSPHWTQELTFAVQNNEAETVVLRNYLIGAL